MKYLVHGRIQNGVPHIVVEIDDGGSNRIELGMTLESAARLANSIMTAVVMDPTGKGEQIVDAITDDLTGMDRAWSGKTEVPS